MAEQDMTATVKTSVVETDEEVFRPGEKTIEVVLQPEPEDEPYYPPYEPYEPLPPFPDLPFIELLPPARFLCVDIETTGANPWESRIICISCRDVEPEAKIVTFSDPDEKVMLQQFITWFRDTGFTDIIGYNVSFDHRFIYAKCLRYLMPFKEWVQANLFDLMNIMKQVKREFVFGYNKPGSLGDWAAFLFGEKKLMTIDELLKAWKDKRIEDIIKHNQKDVELIYHLWLVVNYVEEIGPLG